MVFVCQMCEVHGGILHLLGADMLKQLGISNISHFSSNFITMLTAQCDSICKTEPVKSACSDDRSVQTEEDQSFSLRNNHKLCVTK